MKVLIILSAVVMSFVSAKYGPDCGKGQCGTGNSICPSDAPCCSQAGFCGSTADYCSPAANCQSGCWPKTENAGKCGPAPSYACPDGFCCSKYGYCGKTEDYCSKAMGCLARCWENPNVGMCGPNGECPKNYPCCSQYGYCGNTDAYCNKKKGCKAGCREDPASHHWHGTTSSRELSVAHDFYLQPRTQIGQNCAPNDYFLLSTNTGSLLECEELCAIASKCKAYNWDSNSGNCTGISLKNQVPTISNYFYAGTKMFQHDCQRCQHSFLHYSDWSLVEEFIENDSPLVITFVPSATQMDCELQCSMDSRCLSYSWNTVSQQCYGLRSKRVELTVPVSPVYGTQYYMSGRKVKICTVCHDLTSE